MKNCAEVWFNRGISCLVNLWLFVSFIIAVYEKSVKSYEEQSILINVDVQKQQVAWWQDTVYMKCECDTKWIILFF